jgi:NADPH2:quinone reductase
MRAVTLTEYGSPEVLQITEVPNPVPGPEEVVLEVRATALNRADLLQRMGFYPGPDAVHEIPGMEFAGTVIAVGPRVAELSIGDEIMGIVGGGAYAEQLAVHERQTMPIPLSVDLSDAAAIPEVWITAFDALVAQGGLTSGRTALVHAGASGVGTAAIQIGKAIGASVAVTCSTGKVERCAALGADLVIDYTSEDYVAAVKDHTRGRGVDVILDVIGGDYLARNVEAVAVGGAIVQVGVMGGGESTFPLGGLMPKRASLIGTVLRARPIEEKIEITRRFATEILPLFDSGDAHPVIDRRYGLEEIVEAHRYMETNASVGKILVDVCEEV